MSSAVSHSQQEKFCLRWNDFESNLSEAFKELRQESQFLDVSLLCDGDQQIEAHRVVLSACSGFFRNVLRRSRHQHPLVYLKGIHQADLNHILDFIYYGEVSISQENLNSFLSVAEELKIKGLTQNNLNLEEGKAKTTRSATPVRAGASERKISPTEELVEVKDEDSAQPPTGSQEMEASEMFDDDIQYEDENQFQDIYQSQAGNQGKHFLIPVKTDFCLTIKFKLQNCDQNQNPCH